MFLLEKRVFLIIVEQFEEFFLKIFGQKVFDRVKGRLSFWGFANSTKEKKKDLIIERTVYYS